MWTKEEGIKLLEHAFEMVLLFDKSGKISYANTVARNSLCDGEDLEGTSIESIFPNNIHKNEAQNDADFLDIPDEISEEMTAYRRNNTCFPVEVRIWWDMDLDTYVCMANDILEKEHLQKELEQVKLEASESEKVKSEFVANVTHELRTPVNGVLGNVRELCDVETDDKKLYNLKMIERCCDDMNKLINNILDFSKLQNGKLVLESRRFHFRNMVDYIKATHQKLITEKGLEFFVTVSPSVPEFVVGDEFRIVQILNNLLSNARKFTSVGKISLEIIPTAQVQNALELFFIVSDTGIGIAQKDKDKLFQSFTQVDASISRRFGGTGLGLNISKQLVDLMGGSIMVESQENRGSTFSFSVWVGQQEEENLYTQEKIEIFKHYAASETAHRPSVQTEEDPSKIYGTEENQRALSQSLMKLVLSIEMGNWEKALMFMESAKQLTREAPEEVGKKVLRLKMAVQKEDYDKSVSRLDDLKQTLELQ